MFYYIMISPKIQYNILLLRKKIIKEGFCPFMDKSLNIGPTAEIITYSWGSVFICLLKILLGAYHNICIF